MVARELGTAGAAGVLVSWGALMYVSYRKEARRQAKVATTGIMPIGSNWQDDCKGQTLRGDRSLVLLRRASWRDSALCSFICENGAVTIIALSRLAVTGNVRFSSLVTGRWTKLLIIWLGYIVSERLQLLLHWLLTHKVYCHIPYFHPEEQIGYGQPGGSIGIPKAHGGVRRGILEWMRVSAGSQFILSLLTVTLLGRNSSTGNTPTPTSLSLGWLIKGFNPVRKVITSSFFPSLSLLSSSSVRSISRSLGPTLCISPSYLALLGSCAALLVVVP